MSNAAKDSVFDLLKTLPPAVSPADRLLLLLIADRVNDSKGYAWPSGADLAKRSGLSKGWIWHAVARLEATGFLTVERRFGKQNRYRLVIHNQRGECASSTDATSAVSALPGAVSAPVRRGERARNPLENPLENLAPTALGFTCAECGGAAREHRWRCDACQEKRRTG